MSIRTRLILIFSICLLLASGSISLIVFFSARESAQSDFHALASSQLERVEEHIRTFIEPGAMSVKYLAGLDLVRNSRGKLTSYLGTTETTTLFYANHPPYERRIYDEFIRIHDSNDNFGLVFMANDDGQYAQAPEGHIKAPGYDPRKRPWYSDVMNGKSDVVLSAPYLTTGGGMVCSIMVRTFDMEGRPLGMLGVDYSLASMTKDLHARRILKTGYLVVFDANGRIITDGRHPEYVPMEPEEYPELRRRMAREPDGAYDSVGSRGIAEYIVTRTMAATGWKIAVIFDRSELTASSYVLLRTIVYASVVVLLLAFAIISFSARRIVHPILELVEASSIISSGEYETSETVRARLHEKLSVTGQGESRQLSEALNSMVDTLQERIEAALAASRAKSEFLSNMSHEMRTPMNAIIGMTAIARSSDDAEKKDYCLDRIRDASAHLLGVINDILDMSKIEANKFELSSTEFDFEAMLRKVLDIVGYRAKEKRQDLSAHVDEKIPPLYGDDQRLAQVVANLLSNAVKFTPEGGRVRLEAKLAKEEDGVCTILVEITDTGIGITEEQQARLFHTFEQADSGISRKFGGTGLGLPISKRIVELMGGAIWADSEPGEGSTFSFTAQVRRDRSTAAERGEGDAGEETKEGPDRFEGCRILLAEDVEINREVVIALLEPTGVSIDCAENGAEAVRLFTASPDRYDLIFMDLQMPEMDGYEATRRIRASGTEKGARIPIVAMTANVFREDIEKCLAAGMNDHVGKPLDMGEVMERLRKYLASRSCPQA